MISKLVHRTLLGLILLTHLPARSNDLDIDVASARAAYERQKKVSDDAKSTYDYEYSILRPLEVDLANAQSRLNSANTRVNNAQNNLANLRSELNKLSSTLNNERTSLENLQRSATTIRRDLNSEQDNSNNLERQRSSQMIDINRLKAEIRDEEQNSNDWTCYYRDAGTEEHSRYHQGTGPDRATADAIAHEACNILHNNKCKLVSCEQSSPRLQSLKNELARVQREFENTDANLNQSKSRIRDLEYQLDTNSTEQSQRQQRISNIQNDIENTRLDINGAQQQVTVAQNDRSNAQSEVNQAQASVNLQKPKVDYAKAAYAKELNNTQDLYAYLQQVIANYETEKRNSALLGQEQGAKHGSQEGSERAAPVGTAQGSTDGDSQGKTVGLGHAAERSYVSGYVFGRANGTTSSELTPSYKVGLDKGSELANKKAVSEKLPEGYNFEYSRVIGSVPSSSAKIDITSDIPSDPGSNGKDLRNLHRDIVVIAPPIYNEPVAPQRKIPQPGNITPSLPQADGRYQAQPCDGLRTQEFIVLCKQSYTSGYATGFVDGYNKSFLNSYRTSFLQTAEVAYDKVFTIDQPSEVQKGQKIGAEHAGILKGFEDRLFAANAEMFIQGKAELQSELTQGHLVVARGVTLDETTGDGILSPGEKAKLSIVIDNFGKLSTALEQLHLKITNSQNARSLSVNLRKLPSLQPDTRTTLEGVISAESSAAFAGENVTLEGLLEIVKDDGTFEPIMSFSANKTSHFPIELTSIATAAALPIGKLSEATFQFKNQSNLTIPASKLMLAKNPKNLSVVNPTGVQIPELKSGETTTLKLNVTPDFTIDENSPAILTIDALDDNGLVKTTQVFKQGLPIERPAKLEIINSLGNVINLPVTVRSGSTHRFLVKFSCTTKTTKRPFKFGYFGASEPGVKITDNTTLFATNRECTPTTPPEKKEFSINIPLTAKGKKVTVSMGIDENTSPIHRTAYVIDVQ